MSDGSGTQTFRSTACKVWRQLQREAIAVPRCQVARLMKQMSRAGAVRGKRLTTTVSDCSAPSPLDRVNRQFQVPTPNTSWVSNLTYVANWQGAVYVAFVIDLFARCIVGWRVSRSARADFVLDALEQALCDRRPVRQPGLVHHSDHPSLTDPPIHRYYNFTLIAKSIRPKRAGPHAAAMVMLDLTPGAANARRDRAT
jgi:transposase InsO family protein